MSRVRVTSLRKAFGALTAVDDISFEISAGETFGLLGPNGAGKSTTIGMLVGSLRPDAGQITVDGEDDPTRPSLRARIGVAPQALALYQELTAEENLAFFGSLYGLGGARLRERVEWALAFSGLADRRRGFVKTFSGGMQRRLNLVCGLLHDPPVILLDEPTVGVDPQSRNAIFESIERLKREGRTILYTTHYMEEAERLCDRVAIIDHGRILALDTVAALLDAHGGPPRVEIEFPERPASLDERGGTWHGSQWTVVSDRPEETLRQAIETGQSLRHVTIDRPTLESVFLHLTGRTLRD